MIVLWMAEDLAGHQLLSEDDEDEEEEWIPTYVGHQDPYASTLPPLSHLTTPSPADIPTKERKARLELYNQRWGSIHPPYLPHTLPQAIPFPPSPPFTHFPNSHPSDDVLASSDPALITKWEAYTFFCHAFGFHPLWSNHKDAGDSFPWKPGRQEEAAERIEVTTEIEKGKGGMRIR
jgi:hypothetical protein